MEKINKLLRDSGKGHKKIADAGGALLFSVRLVAFVPVRFRQHGFSENVPRMHIDN